MRIEVVYALAHAQTIVELELEQGARVADAIAAAGLQEQTGASSRHAVGIWGKPVTPDTPLRAGDRVEIYRELIADPKQARRQQARAKQATLKRR